MKISLAVKLVKVLASMEPGAICRFCGVAEHADDCVWAKARELVDTAL